MNAPDRHARLTRLPKAPEQQDPLGFDALREQAIALAQAASGQLWTDYNLHDPGVTLLEAFCFALSEDVYANRQEVLPLLGLPEDGPVPAAALARHALFSRNEALPSRPLTEADYQRWLFDLWPDKRHLRLQAQRDTQQRANGLWRLSRLCREREQRTLEPMSQAKAYWACRNLGEDLIGCGDRLAPDWVRLRCKLVIEPEWDPAELLVNLLKRCDDYLSARPVIRELPELASPARSGPLMSQGWVTDKELRRCQAKTLNFSDLAQYLRALDGLCEIVELDLEPVNPSDASAPGNERARALPMRRGDRALRLVWPSSAEDLRGWSVSLSVGGASVPLQALWQQLEDARRTPRRQRLPALQRSASRIDAAESLGPYVPAARHLPEVYRHPGRHGAVLELREGDPAQRLQWHAYLCLMEHGLAHARAQQQHIGALFDIEAAQDPSYWWDLPGDAQLRGLEAPLAGLPALYRRPRQALQQDFHSDIDAGTERRQRALDQLLALHGEALDFRSLAGVPCYWSPQAWARHLLRCKQRFARQLPRLTRDRGAAFDYSQALLERPMRCAPLQTRLALQLGLQHGAARLGLQRLARHQVQLSDDASAGPPRGLAPASLEALHLQAVALPSAAAQRALLQRMREHLPWLRQALSTSLLRTAVQPLRYQFDPQTRVLHLLADGATHSWRLARTEQREQAVQLALRLQQLACALQLQAEGLHLVEHLLLRPDPEHGDSPDDWHVGKLSLIIPGWTARGHDRRFRRLLREALLQAAPVHLECRVLFLELQDQQRFEQLYPVWLAARRALCQEHEPGNVARLEQASAALSAWLRPLWQRRVRGLAMRPAR